MIYYFGCPNIRTKNQYEYPCIPKNQLGLSGRLAPVWGVVSFLTPKRPAAAASSAATGRFIVLYFERRSLRAREQLLSFALMQKKVTKEKIKSRV
jgi:hypothetical protein